MNLDTVAARWIDARAGRWRALDAFAIFLARFCSLLEIVLVLLLPLARGWRGMRGLLHSALSLLLATNVVYFLRRTVPRTRPYVAREMRQLVERRPGPSFPSRHVASAFAMALPAWREHRGIGGAMLALAALLGLSRVYTGLHYPSDVLAGAGLGLASAWVVEGSARAGGRASRRGGGER